MHSLIGAPLLSSLESMKQLGSDRRGEMYSGSPCKPAPGQQGPAAPWASLGCAGNTEEDSRLCGWLVGGGRRGLPTSSWLFWPRMG